MFGLMKVSTHEAAMKEKDAYRADLKLANRMMANERDAAKTRASTAEVEVVTLKGQLEAMTVDRDNWKQCEGECAMQYDKLKAENAALKTRLGDCPDHLLSKIDQGIKKGARRTGSRFKLTEAAKVPVKGKVK